jgi:hypothetical protein
MMARQNAQIMAEQAAEKLRQSVIQQAAVAKEAIKAIDEGVDPTEALKAAEEKITFKPSVFRGETENQSQFVKVFAVNDPMEHLMYVSFNDGSTKYFKVDSSGHALVSPEVAAILIADHGYRIEES